MKVSCPACQNSYNIDDKRIPPGGAKLKCPKCQNVFPIKPAAAAAGGAVPLPGGAGGSGAVPLPGGAGGMGAVPLPGGAGGMGAVPLPGAGGEDPESTRAMSMSALPQDAFPDFGSPPPRAGAAVPLPGMPGAARDFDFASAEPVPDLGAPGQGYAPVPEPGAEFDFGSPPPGAGGFGQPPPAHAADFADLPAPAGGLDFGSPPPPAHGAAMDFADLPTFGRPPPAAAAPMAFDAPMDFGSPPPPPRMDFGDLPSPVGPADLPSPAGPGNLPSPAGAVPSYDIDFGEAPPPAPAHAVDLPLDFAPSAPPPPPDMSTDFGAVDFGSAPPAGAPGDLDMLDYGDGAGADAARRFHVRRRSGKVFGPFEEAVVVKMLEDGQLLGNEDVSTDAAAWEPIGTVPVFSATLQRLMEGGGGAAPAASGGGAPQVTVEADGGGSYAQSPSGQASMDRLRQLYEGRMAAVSVVDGGRQSQLLRAKLPLLVGGAAIVLVLGAGASLGLTRYGVFGIHKLLPARVSSGSPEAAQVEGARKALLQGTVAGYKKARDTSAALLAQKEYPEVRALWAQAVLYLDRKHRAAGAGEVDRAHAALEHVELLGERHPEYVKMRAGLALLEGRGGAEVPLLADLAQREANAQDVELSLLLAEAQAQGGDLKGARATLERVTARRKDLAKAHHALGDVLQRAKEADKAAEAYRAAVAADPGYVSSALELAAVELLVRKDAAAGKAAVAKALEGKAAQQLGVVDRARAAALEGVGHALEGKHAEAEQAFRLALAKDPANLLAQASLARTLVELKRHADAVPLYKAVAEREPKSVEYAEGLVGALFGSGQVSLAQQAVEQAQQRFPGEARLALWAARVADANDNPVSAEAALRRALEASPDLLEAQLDLASFLVRHKRPDEAKAVLDAAAKAQPDAPGVRASLGELALAQGDLEAAGRELARALELDPQQPRAHLDASRLALRQGDLPRALAEADAALALVPRQLKDGRLQKGLVLWRMGQLEPAVAVLEEAKAEDPRSVPVAVTLGAVKYDRKDYAGAEAVLLLALQSEPSNPEALYHLGRVRAARAQYGGALDAMKTAVERAPKRPEFQYALGTIYRDAKQMPNAVAAWQQALELKPDYADAHEALGLAALDRGDVERAVASLEAALQADPARTHLIAAAGDAFFNAQRWKEAIARYQAALQADPKLTVVLYKLGRAHAESGQTAKAVEWYQRATQQDPDNAMPYYYLGFAFKERGRKADAVKAFQQYLARKPDATDKKEIEDEIYDLTH